MAIKTQWKLCRTSEHNFVVQTIRQRTKNAHVAHRLSKVAIKRLYTCECSATNPFLHSTRPSRYVGNMSLYIKPHKTNRSLDEFVRTNNRTRMRAHVPRVSDNKEKYEKIFCSTMNATKSYNGKCAVCEKCHAQISSQSD